MFCMRTSGGPWSSSGGDAYLQIRRTLHRIACLMRAEQLAACLWTKRNLMLQGGGREPSGAQLPHLLHAVPGRLRRPSQEAQVRLSAKHPDHDQSHSCSRVFVRTLRTLAFSLTFRNLALFRQLLCSSSWYGPRAFDSSSAPAYFDTATPVHDIQCA
jgi:hypothetical protein